jgi:signal transduction histidine kinase
MSFVRKPKVATFAARFRSGSATVFVAFLYGITLLGSMYTIDVAYYQHEKWQLISESINGGKYFDRIAAADYTRAVTTWVEATGRPNREELFREIERRGLELLALSPAVTRVTLEEGSGLLLSEVGEPERLERQNNFSNSLFYRGFERSVQRQFNLNASEEPVARFRIHVTSSLNDPALSQLTNHYWRVVLAVFLGLTALYYSLVRWVMSPLHRVTYRMQERESGHASIIDQPKTLIERSYNDLARDAALTRFSKELRERIAAGGLSWAQPILEMAPELVEEYIGIASPMVLSLQRRGGKGGWSLERVIGTMPGYVESTRLGAVLTEHADQNDPTERAAYWSARLLSFADAENQPIPFFCDVLHASTEELWLLIVPSPPGRAPFAPWWVDFLGRVAQELRYALTSIDDQRRLILQEKSKANISLSRNLGHDLTNIIATSKLELMTVRTFLSLPPTELTNPRKEAIFRESLEALLNNTRFLQEMVNIYRSFSFLQKPKFEEVNLSELAEDIVRLYQPSLSKDFGFRLELAPGLPTTTVEPRLLRLALFNLMTNATEAIRRAAKDGKPRGCITVGTALGAGDMLEMWIADDGPGIRDADGKLMSGDGLSEIFRLGFSTKKSQEGEGLGLNWVQSIVREFHGGEILARNQEQGGAMFIIRLPRQAAESRERETT